MTSEQAILIYDGECPVCSSYVKYLRIRESVGPVKLINARDGGEHVEEVRKRGISLDEGMALIYGGRLYHGADCVHMLALLSSESSVFNKFNAAIFRHRGLARVLYPLLRAGRNLLLAMLGKSRLNDAFPHNRS